MVTLVTLTFVNIVLTCTEPKILNLFFKKAVARVQRIFTIHSLHVGFQVFLEIRGYTEELLTRSQVNYYAPNGMINAGDHYKKVGTTNVSRHRITRGKMNSS